MSTARPSTLCEQLLALIKGVTPYTQRTPRDVFQGRVGDQPQIAGDRYVLIVPDSVTRNATLLDNRMCDLSVEARVFYQNTADNWSRAIDDQAQLVATIDEWTVGGVYAVTIDAASVTLATEDVIQATINVSLVFNLE